MNEPRAEGEIVNIGRRGAGDDARARPADQGDDRQHVGDRPRAVRGGVRTGFEDIRTRIPDLTKIGSLIGFRPEIPLDAILRDMIEDGRRRLGH